MALSVTRGNSSGRHADTERGAARGLSASLSESLTGIALTATVGAVSFSGMKNVPITNISLVVLAGSLAAAESLGLTRLGLAANVGSLSGADSQAANGVQAAPSGISVSASFGSLLAQNASSLTGVIITASVSGVGREVDDLLYVPGLNALVGQLSQRANTSITGIQVNAAVAAIVFNRQRRFAGALMI
jgi:hypothetical protein